MNRVVWESKVANPHGVHCRVAAKLAEIVTAHKVQVLITAKTGTADCASILEVLSLALTQGSRVSLTAEGQDAAQAAEAIDRLLSDGEES
jgi:phosphocarrier protein HPr